MQENNNFETIKNKWQRLSVVEQVDQKETVPLASMSGDSSSQHTFLKNKDEEPDVLVPRNSGHMPVTLTGAAVATSELSPDITSTNPEEQQEFIKHDMKDENKDAADDSQVNDKISEKDYLENDEKKNRSGNVEYEKEKLADNVDSVYLRSPPPHKTRSTASTVEEEDCGIKCLYFTLQCCDCVLM